MLLEIISIYLYLVIQTLKKIFIKFTFDSILKPIFLY